MNKVYVPNLASHDFSTAAKYGELVYITVGSQNRFAVDSMVRAWAKALKKSASDDYIIISGLSHHNAIGTAIFGMLHKKLNLLIYKGTGYVARTVLLDQAVAAEIVRKDN